MQKKIIALALAAAAGSAFAQTNVQVYGVVDLGQSWVKTTGGVAGTNQASVGRLDSNSSLIGFRGTEDLGNGLKALFQYETGFDASTAGALAGGRDTFIGLTGGFGTVVAGTLTHPLRAMGAKVELVPGATGIGATMALTGRIAGGNTGADDRATNAIAYVSPSFSGFSGTVAYINGEFQNQNAAAGAQSEQRAYQLAAQYDNGPLYVAGGYHKADNAGGVDAADARIYRLAAVYTLPTATKLTALFDNTKAENVGGTFAKRNAWSIGAAQSFGKNTVGLEYAKSADVKTNAGTVNNGASMWTAVYTYELSKRTSVHARYSRISNDTLGATNFYVNPIGNPNTVTADATASGYMVGLRHSF